MKIESAKVKDLMTPHPASVRVEERLDVAKSTMRLGRIRHLPVVDDDDRVIGVLSDRDLAMGALFKTIGIAPGVELDLLSRMRVEDVVSNCAITVGPDAPIQEAAGIMNRHKISCLPVVDGETLAGVLTERDFVVALTNLARPEPAEDAPGAAKSWTWATLEEEFEHLRTLRDELRVQLRLASMDARDGFDEAEKRWAQIERKLGGLGNIQGQATEEALRVGKNFVQQTRTLYEDLKGKVYK